jgi:hypothetical protein
MRRMGNLLQLLRQAGMEERDFHCHAGLGGDGKGGKEGRRVRARVKGQQNNSWRCTHKSYEAYVKRRQMRRLHSSRVENRCLAVSGQQRC